MLCDTGQPTKGPIMIDDDLVILCEQDIELRVSGMEHPLNNRLKRVLKVFGRVASVR